MSHWNYRAVKKDGVLGVHAVYYADDGNIEGWSERPFSPVADSLDELRTSLELMLESLEQEVIEVE